jgi:hypothetical protein
MHPYHWKININLNTENKNIPLPINIIHYLVFELLIPFRTPPPGPSSGIEHSQKDGGMYILPECIAVWNRVLFKLFFTCVKISIH